MKNNNSIYGVVALISFVASTVLSHLWSSLDSAVYGVAALVCGAAFVWAAAKAIGEVERSERTQVKNVDFTRASMNKAA